MRHKGRIYSYTRRTQFLLLLVCLLILAGSCTNGPESPLDLSHLQSGLSPDELATPGPIFLNGKLKSSTILEGSFLPASPDSVFIPQLTADFRTALFFQLETMEKKRSRRSWTIGDRTITHQDLVDNIRMFLECGENPLLLQSQVQLYQSWGRDRRGHVKFTGYFSPVLPVRKTPDSIYKYPICRRPEKWEGTYPAFSSILRDSALAGQELEIAYASDPIDIYQFQIQGSGYVEFLETGEQFMLEYDGSNRQPRRSIERYLSRRKDTLGLRNLTLPGIQEFLRKNPVWLDSVMDYTQSYIFFKPEKHRVKGAAQVPLTELVSVAVDQRVIPLGSILLGAVPVHDRRGNIIHHHFRLLLAQDTGGAIKGPGRIDLYCGVGEQGKREANKYNHYGRLWLLLPPEKDAQPSITQVN